MADGPALPAPGGRIRGRRHHGPRGPRCDRTAATSLTASLLHAEVVADIERAASQHLGRPWTAQGFTDRSDRASHPCGILHGEPFSVFAKLGTGPADREQFGTELAGLRMLSQLAQVATPVPVAGGLAGRPGRTLLLSEALPECLPKDRGSREWKSIGQTLAALHQVSGPRFGLGGQRASSGRCRRTTGPSRRTAGRTFTPNAGSSRCCG